MSSERSAGRRARSPSDPGDGPARLDVRTLLTGVAVRPLAQSARRAGIDAASVDLFGDRDHRRALPVLSLGRAGADGYAAADLVRLCRRVAADEVAYGADLENHPRLVVELSEGRRLLGNPPRVLRRVRDPSRLEASLREGGLPAPEVRRHDDPLPSDEEDPGWLRKPLRGGGGRWVRPWRPGESVGEANYLQRRIRGAPVSLAFLADGRSGRLLAVTEMLVGRPVFGAEGFTYCGSLLRVGGGDRPAPPPGPAGEVPWATARRIVRRLSADFGLRGLNGLDAVLDGKTLWPVEVNPRWTASMELLEPGPWDGEPAGPTLFELHRRACRGDLPAEAELREIRIARRWSSLAATGAEAGEPGGDGKRRGREEGARVVGKAILRAPAPVRTPDLEALDGIVVADVPDPGEEVPAGAPVCTILAAGRDRAACLDRLAASAARIRSVLEPREG